MARIKSFNRRELKFIIRTDQMQPFVDDIMPFLNRDSYTDKSDTYRITSLYYDTSQYMAYRQKIEGVKHRRKLRIRVYGEGLVKPEDECFVEIKERIDQSVRKRRIIIPYGDARSFCKTGELDPQYDNEADRPVIDEIAHLVKLLNLQPSCALRYDRQPFNGNPYYDPSLRITFDTNCRARIHDLDLETSTLEEMHFFLSPQLSILEIKADDRVPYWLVQKLHQHKFMLHKISKYCTALENLAAQFHRQIYIFPSKQPDTNGAQLPASRMPPESQAAKEADPGA
jgi:SPX domain protein involved in polyphosphate accumulation